VAACLLVGLIRALWVADLGLEIIFLLVEEVL